MDAINGKEMQIESTSLVIHEGNNIELKIVELNSKLNNVFHGEYGNKAIRISYQRGKNAFFFNAGFEQNMYNEVMEYIRTVVEKDGQYPFVFTLHNFLSFTPLRNINED